ncbi:asparaginase [Leifsonia sp. YIM 134122]|uniref:Asparaginase n=1 Tax=Leifsonia stereocauli TaxID=3134136 RepID=A0ABU9W5E8_9MICO
MTETFQVEDSVEVAVVERSGFIESRHAGSAVVISAAGDIVRTVGDIASPVFPRSALKPFQAVAVMSSGVTLRGTDAAIATASHSGTARHVDLVRGVLARAGVPESALACPDAYPQDTAARDAVVRANGPKSPLYMNCSGKHAAMLAACAANGWPLKGYLDMEHPLQRRILDIVERFTGERPAATGIDGCGAPVHAISLTALARGIQRVTTSTPSSPFAIYREAGALTEAVREHPWVIAGPGLGDSITIERLGVFSKYGAEGSIVMTAPDGTTVAAKVLDGNIRVVHAVALRLLVQAGALDAEAVAPVLEELDLWVTGGAGRVGRIRATV